MTKINLDKEILGRDGKPLMANEDEAATIRSILFMSIDAQLPGDDKTDAAQKLKLVKLSRKLGETDPTFSVSERNILLERAAVAMSVLVYGQLVEVLDPSQLEA